VSRQAVSKHLTTLGQVGLVESRRSGRETRYRLTPEPLGEALVWLEQVGAQWDERLARLREHLTGPHAVPGEARHRLQGEPSSSR
jgi:DNA-binding transcriptional ArsR family regulator